jgi:hypothetical protein
MDINLVFGLFGVGAFIGVVIMFFWLIGKQVAESLSKKGDFTMDNIPPPPKKAMIGDQLKGNLSHFYDREKEMIDKNKQLEQVNRELQQIIIGRDLVIEKQDYEIRGLKNQLNNCPWDFDTQYYLANQALRLKVEQLNEQLDKYEKLVNAKIWLINKLKREKKAINEMYLVKCEQYEKLQADVENSKTKIFKDIPYHDLSLELSFHENRGFLTIVHKDKEMPSVELAYFVGEFNITEDFTKEDAEACLKKLLGTK